MKGTKTYNSNFPKNPQGWSSNEKRKCFRCGYYQGHSKEQCPAKVAICNKCRKKGHFAKVCHTKTVQEVSSSQNYAFIGIVGMQENAEDKWCEVIKVNDQPIKFKIDTGAEVSVMPEGIYLQHFGYLKTEKADKNLFAVSKKIEVNGMFQAFLESKRQNCEETIYIVKGVARPLLSCRASEILGLVRRINIVEDHTPTKLDPMLKFPKLFNGLGKLDIPYEIKLKEGAKPYSIYTPRRVPIPLMKELQMELERMTSNGVIEKVEGSSEWCSPMVLVAKPSGKLRICVDLSILNKNILREIHPIPVVEHTLAQLKGAKVFTKLDANSGFWQIPLSSESSALTTFITPFGRFRFKRLPFGISSAPEIFQKRMGQILEGLEGTLCHMDDIMVYGSCQEEHDKRLETVLTRVSKSGLTLNKDKCKFAVTTIKFLGHQIGPNGIQVDPKRKRAILEFPKPRSVKELKQFLGMVNFSARFVPNLAEIAHPMNKLLSKKEEWIWGDDQDRAFDQIKKNLTSAQGLALYDPSLPITVSADASSFGLGAVIWQTKDGLRQVIAYASRTLSETEKRYAQIKKEALAITWACEKFKQYIQGLVITLETDHKPLVPIFTSKNIDDLTPRIQRLRLRIMRYSYKIVHTPGKNLIVADALSRSPRTKVGTQELEEELCAYVQQVVSFMPISDVRVKEIKESQDKDQVIQNIIKYTQEGWPERTNVSMSKSQYWPAKDDFSVENGILLKGSRYVIPENIRKGLLQRIHEGHLGIVKCRERAKGSVWWPWITSEIEEMVRTCPMCIEERTNRHQPLLPSELPNCPWEKVGVDLFTLKGQNYLLIADYYSRYPEIARLEDITSASVIVHCKSIFARHGIPLEVRSDNGPQFGSLFKEFAHEYGFTHVTSSPRYPQSNGFIESFVKIVKERISKSKDPYLALLAYRATPLANGFSPAELSMGRRDRTTIPTPTKQHQPPNLKNLKNQETIQREKQKYYFDRAKGVRELPPLDVNDRVWLTDLKTPGVIISKADTPRSYVVDTPRGSVRRNRFHLLPTGQRSPGPPHFEPDEEPYINCPEANTHTSDAPTDVTDSSTSPKEALYRTRCGRTNVTYVTKNNARPRRNSSHDWQLSLNLGLGAEKQHLESPDVLGPNTIATWDRLGVAHVTLPDMQTTTSIAGIVGISGIRQLELNFSHSGEITSDLMGDSKELRNAAFRTSLIAEPSDIMLPAIPISEIKTEKYILSAFPHCFCNEIEDMGGGSTIIAPKLTLKTDKPVYRAQYPIPNNLLPQVKDLVDKLTKGGIVERSTSLWNSPLFPVVKSDGSVRITLDLRRPQSFFPFPIPRIEENLRAFTGAKIFSTIDLTSGFFQIHLPEEDREFFAFSLPWGVLSLEQVTFLAPLNDLLKNGRKFLWESVHQEAFDQVKARLTSFPILVHPDPNKSYLLYTDASGIAVGACLCQEEDGATTPNQKSETVARILISDVISHYGVPKTILSDRGSVFMSRVFKSCCYTLGVEAVHTTAWRPQSNVAAERLNRTVIESLRKCASGSSWDELLPLVAMSIRSTLHASTGYSPAKLLYGYEMRLPELLGSDMDFPIPEGPYKVIRRAGLTVYLLEDMTTKARDKYHIDRIKLYHQPIAILKGPQEEPEDDPDEPVLLTPAWVNHYHPPYLNSHTERNQGQEATTRVEVQEPSELRRSTR
ncbi:K02A2.6-like, partial [Cordylochernes scorpioides]